MSAARIDVHQHLIPTAYAEWLQTKGIGQPGGRQLPSWTSDSALALMDQFAIATAILSLSSPGTYPANDPITAAEAGAWTQRINDVNAELVKERPDRFGMFATLPLPDVDGALAEIARAYDELGTDGVVLLANHRGTYLGDPAFNPVMDELDRRAAVVFVHPTDLPGPTVEGIPTPAADFLLDTTRAAINLVRHDVPHRYPGIRFVLSHAGGFVPYASHRIALITARTDRNQLEVLEDLSTFWFDTALSASFAALPSLLAFARPRHVLFGSDWPFSSDTVVGYFTSQLDSYPQLDEAGHTAINRANALQLFPRLAPMHA